MAPRVVGLAVLSTGSLYQGGWDGVPRLSFAYGLDLVLSGMVFSLMLCVRCWFTRLRWSRFLFFSLASGVGPSRGRGGFVFVFSRSSASYSDHSSKLTMF